MLEVNPGCLAAFESDLHTQGKRLIAGCEELAQIRSALAQLTQMDGAIAAIRSCAGQMEEAYGKLTALERAAEQIARAYSDCERRITDVCEQEGGRGEGLGRNAAEELRPGLIEDWQLKEPEDWERVF